jgi:hypothetical protein
MAGFSVLLCVLLGCRSVWSCSTPNSIPHYPGLCIWQWWDSNTAELLLSWASCSSHSMLVKRVTVVNAFLITCAPHACIVGQQLFDHEQQQLNLASKGAHAFDTARIHAVKWLRVLEVRRITRMYPTTLVHCGATDSMRAMY